jgi:S1-C subfamily serine protease
MRSNRALVVLIFSVIACRREVAPLDDVQKMAYGAKPAVVRVNAYATAEFRYSTKTINAIAQEIGIEQALEEANLAIPTGAGGSGTGFLINPDGWILTSGHVVAPTRDAVKLRSDLLRNGAIAALLKHLPVDELRRLHRDSTLEKYVGELASSGMLSTEQTVNEVELSNGANHPFRVERYSPALTERGNDLALLRVGRTNLPVLPLGDSDLVRVGESIWSIGYPAVASSTDEVIGGWLSGDSDLEATLTPGTITAIKTNITKTPVFQSNVGIYRGNSGGPVVNRQGEVIGIATWGHTDAEQIKFLVPINVAKTFLSETRVAYNVESEFNRHYSKALDAAAGGNWNEANEELNRASALFPSSPDLVRVRNDIDRAMQAMPIWRKHPFAAIAVSVSAVGMMVALVLPFVSRRRLPPPDPLFAQTVEMRINPIEGVSPRNNGTLGRLTILNGERAGERLGLGGSGIRIGRESAICEIVLENPKVSRLHAEVVSIDGKVLLIDRNSSNGTYVNDQKIDKRFLQDGDIIYFGGRNAVAVAFNA